jgi:hypothetical protein
MSLTELRKKITKLSKAKETIWEKFNKGEISFNFYREYCHTVERLQCSLIEKYHKEYHSKYDTVHTGLPFYGIYSDNTIIRITQETVYECKSFCYICSRADYTEGFGKVLIF